MIRLTNASGAADLDGPEQAECLHCNETRDCVSMVVSTRPDVIFYLCGQCLNMAVARLLVDRISVDEGRNRDDVAREIAEAGGGWTR